MSLKVSDFKSIKLRLASEEDILSWSHGEVTKSETINYRTQRAEKDGLFCEKIFGPEKDWECYCGKYRRIRYKGIVCDKCGVEVTRSIVRRERMGHIKLASPVTHIWFLKGVPSKIGALLDIPVSQLEKVAYFTAYVITRVDENAKAQVYEELEKEFKQKNKEEDPKMKEELKEKFSTAKEEIKGIQKMKIISEPEYYNLSLKYGEIFKADTGASALRQLVSEVDLAKTSEELENAEKTAPAAQKTQILKRLRVVQAFQRSGVLPTSMFLTVIPIMPPGLRPMVQLDGGRYASSDLNDLYRRVINRNNRLKKLLDLNAPEVIVRNEKRMLQEAVDALIDNSARKGSAVMAATGQKRQLKSLADMLKGKSGRFRQNLLGKRVDYSGRSVIVVGPELKLGECGLPKKMALELFKPFVINKIIEKELAYNIRGAGRLLEDTPDEIWAILEDVIKDKHVLLNRAPTLHRLGIQAFRPILIEGMAIRLHPLVCTAFNADFDGDQMAVHLPLTEEAQKEARDLMIASKNLLKPATGEPITNPSQDIVLGAYFLTSIKEGTKGEGKVFASKNEAVLAYDFNLVDINAKIKVRAKPEELKTLPEGEKYLETSAGRIIFNRALPNDFGFVNKELNKKELETLTADIIEKYGDDAAKILDVIKTLGFKYATKSGMSWGMNDLHVPKEKYGIVEEAEKEVNEIYNQYQAGLLTNSERYDRVIEIWHKAKSDVGKIMPSSLEKYGSVYNIFHSKARGSQAQLVQMSGMKGPVVNPAGKIIELPIKKSYKEGLEVLEYFIATHGARKGTADTALRTASAGYLTRRLVDVAQDVVVREIDCGDDRGVVALRADSMAIGQNFASRISGRFSLEDVKGKDGKTIVKKGDIISKEAAEQIDKEEVESVNLRSVMLCKAEDGVCQTCYGYDLGHNKVVKMGAPVGIVAAQAIGEPGTQLTMRTFHIGGVAGGGDITQGLPRVEEVFEARPPKGRAFLAEAAGKIVEIERTDKAQIVKIEVDDATFKPEIKKRKSKLKSEEKSEKEYLEYALPLFSALWVGKGDRVEKGTQLCEGHLDIGELFKVAGVRQTERYIISEIQKIYLGEGAAINDKHIEVIIRQMFARVRVKESGDTKLIAGDIVEKGIFKKENKKAKEEDKNQAVGAQLLLGITKVSLSTESFLSAASFQETSKVLINASIAGKEDHLKGLKENVIIGKLIPAGTGFAQALR